MVTALELLELATMLELTELLEVVTALELLELATMLELTELLEVVTK